MFPIDSQDKTLVYIVHLPTWRLYLFLCDFFILYMSNTMKTLLDFKNFWPCPPLGLENVVLICEGLMIVRNVGFLFWKKFGGITAFWGTWTNIIKSVSFKLLLSIAFPGCKKFVWRKAAEWLWVEEKNKKYLFLTLFTLSHNVSHLFFFLKSTWFLVSLLLLQWWTNDKLTCLHDYLV